MLALGTLLQRQPGVTHEFVSGTAGKNWNAVADLLPSDKPDLADALRTQPEDDRSSTTDGADLPYDVEETTDKLTLVL